MLKKMVMSISSVTDGYQQRQKLRHHSRLNLFSALTLPQKEAQGHEPQRVGDGLAATGLRGHW